MSKHQSPTAGENTAAAKRSKAAPAKRKAAKERVLQYPFAVFTEWTGEADEKAYADL
ncbi:MAG TPA: hypothetical protein VGO01_04520 [Bradyrhizobium sp.]|jgi:hypothetical protein|nr:hypothetical protein [Bradyrhizobium sp.]